MKMELMRMNINILGTSLKKNEVLFACEFGEGRGTWCGAAVAAGEICGAEFELPRCSCAGWILCRRMEAVVRYVWTGMLSY